MSSLTTALSKSDELFTQYCEIRDEFPLDPTSTLLVRMSAKCGMGTEDLMGIMEAQGWSDQYNELKMAHTRSAIESVSVSAVLKHLKLSSIMQNVALEALESVGEDGGLEVKTVEQARRLAQTGIELERLTLGQATKNVKVSVENIDERIEFLKTLLEDSEVIEGDYKKIS